MFRDDPFKIELTFEGEGYNGEYNENDPEDQRLLRFTIYKTNDGNTYEQIDEGSYCTQITDNNDPELIEKVEKALMTIFRKAEELNSYKRILQTLSWLTDEDIKKLK